MSDLFKHLNPEQRKAVETTEGPILVLSGAGTGKTRVLTTRIAHILQMGLAQPWEILALTFTNKAANEMRARVAGFVVGENPSDIWLGTFHSVCLRMLRRNAERADVRKDFLVFGEDEQKAVMKTVIGALNLDIKNYPPAEWVEKISAIKDKGLNPDVSKTAPLDKIYTAYNAELTRLNAVDFGDIILKVLGLFVSAPDILQKYQRQFKYILVDEFQDTNAAQHQFLRLLAVPKGPDDVCNICCVGDDDQSIYSWRGAEIKNILNFEREYPGARIVRLETNYRSGSNILCAANSLIRHNRGRLGKELRACKTNDTGDKVRIWELASDFDESRAIADMIESDKNNLSDFAILIRAGALSRQMEEEFARRGLPYKLVGALRFYDRMEIRDTIAYLRLLAYPFDDLSFLRIISRPRRGFGDGAIGKLREFAEKNRCGLLGALREIRLPGKQRISADEFMAAFDFDWGKMLPADAAAEVLEKAGYIKMWKDSKDTDSESRLENINELIKNVISKYDSIAEFLEHAALMMTEDDNNEGAKGNCEAIPIMTIHAAKGLEFDTVFCPAWEEGIFPNEMAINGGGLEEERRLAYVAITRAKRRCIISHATGRMLYGTRQYNPPSRFIEEIDKEFTRETSYMRPRIYENFTKTTDSKRKLKRTNSGSYLVGKLVSHPELGGGVVIEQEGALLTIAFKDKGIKKVNKEFVQ